MGHLVITLTMKDKRSQMPAKEKKLQHRPASKQ